MDLNEIIKRCQLGEKEAFSILFSSVEKKALSTAYLISGTRGIAEDILQETYIKCFKGIKNLKDPKSFNLWFYRILVRTGWEMTKKHSLTIPANTSDYLLLSSDENQTIENIIDENEKCLTVQSAINKLSPKLKTVVILYYFNGMTDSEISKVLGCLKGTVKSRLFYSRNILKRELGDYFSVDLDYSPQNGKECYRHE